MKTTIGVTRLNEDESKYIQVKNNLKKWIVSKNIRQGEKVPSENQLVDLFHVSRHTIRQAIGELVNEGWLLREQGRGTFVNVPFQSSGGDNVPSRTKIAVITTYLADYIFPHIISGIESVVSENGHTLSLLSTGNAFSTERRSLETVILEGVDGLIIEPTKSTLPNLNIDLYFILQERNIPFVMLHSSYVELNASIVALDDSKGAYLATKHLIDLGHEKISGIFKSDDMQGRNRFKGFVKAHQDAHLSVESKNVATYDTENRIQVVENFVAKIFHDLRADRPTAVVCYNDEVAIMVINILRTLGLDVPNDVSVTGFDDSVLAQAGSVALTTVNHPKSVMGEKAVNQLYALMNDKQGMWIPREYVFEPDLIVRGSTSSPH